MNAAFTIVRLFPYWALVAALSFVEIGLHYRRRGMRGKMVGCALVVVIFLALVGLWFTKRGDLNSGAWVRAWLGG